jgi:hypothetical protein
MLDKDFIYAWNIAEAYNLARHEMIGLVEELSPWVRVNIFWLGLFKAGTKKDDCRVISLINYSAEYPDNYDRVHDIFYRDIAGRVFDELKRISTVFQRDEVRDTVISFLPLIYGEKSNELHENVDIVLDVLYCDDNVDCSRARDIVYMSLIESMVVYKREAIRYLNRCGYSPQRSDVKGLSPDFVREVITEAAATPLPSENAPDAAQEKDIAAWQTLLDEGRLSSADRIAVALVIEKIRGKTHKEAYDAVLPTEYKEDKHQFVSKRRPRARKLASLHGLTMPDWRSSR